MGAGIQTLVAELLTQPYDSIFELIRTAVGDPFGGFGAGRNGVVATLSKTDHERPDPALGDAVGGCNVAGAAALQHHRVDDEANELHGPPPR
ncbi:MAG: hypothetical protein ABR529_15280 [Actinomycetota bacterium]